MIQPIIMAGGSGSRLWPFSRQSLPKQLLSLTGSQHSMLQDTVNRLDNLSSNDPTVICNEEYRFLVAEQLRLSGRNNSSIILEPVGRNTAPAIALAAFEATQNGDDPLLLILAADNHIEDISAFHHAVQTAIPLAESGKLVTFGIVPTAPETGYGYIQQGEPLGEQSYRVNRFVEKPDLDTAQNYINSGEYYWNSGMFLFRASQFLSELEQYRPEIFATCKKAISNQESNSEFIHIDKDVFLTCPGESVDYAVMENSSNVAMVSLDAGWNDIGSWSSLWEVSQKCEQGNSTTGDVVHHNTQNSLIKARHRLVATVGIENLAVIETKDAVLIAHKDSVQDVKHIVEHLKNEDRQEHINHTEVQRPWGKYESIDSGINNRLR